MNNLLHAFAEYPVLVGIAVFLVISLLLPILLGVLMRRAGVSLKPLVFFFGFLAIIAVPQMVVHLLDAFVHAREIHQQPTEGAPDPFLPKLGGDHQKFATTRAAINRRDACVTPSALITRHDE